MDTIYFATTNEGKLREARNILKIPVESTPLEIDEIQSLDPVDVATKKAEAYYSKLKKSILVEDVSLFFDSLSGLPGTYINDFIKVLGNNGLIKLISGSKNRKALAQTTLVYIDSDGKKHVFIGKVKGKIADRLKGQGFGWDPIFIPEGENKTFGQMSLEEKNKFSMRAKALKKFKKWLK